MVLLLLAQVLELGVHDLALLRPARGGVTVGGRAAGARGARALALRLAIHGLRELVRGLGQRLLRPLHALEVVRLEGLARFRERVLDTLSIGLGQLAAVLGERAL